MKKGTTLGVAATVTAAAVWGTSFSVNDIGLHSVGPITFVVLRFAIAGVVVLAAALAMGRFSAAPARSLWFWGLALANALGFVLQYLGQQRTTPARTALLVNTSAFTVALLERFVLGRPLSAARWLLIAAGSVGAGILVVGGSTDALAGGQLWGDLLVAMSGLLWAVYFILNARAVERYDAVAVSGWTFALSALIAAPLLFLDASPLQVAPGGGWAVLYTGLATTALAYGLWTFGLKHLRPSASAVLLLVEILVASIVSLALHRETFGLVEIAGAVILVGAVVGMTLVEERAGDAPAST